MTIRASTERDAAALEALHRAAFGASEGPVIAGLVADLRRDDTARPLLSLVAEERGRPVGHIIFSAVSVDGHAEVPVRLLAPLAVAPGHQGRGIGGALIAEGLARLTAAEVACVLVLVLVLVLGDPHYYARAGFRAGHGIAAPHPLAHPEAWMVCELVPGALGRLAGRARCATSLQARALW